MEAAIFFYTGEDVNLRMIRRMQGFVRQMLARQGFFPQVLVLAGGTAFAQILTVAVSPILTRLFTPAEFGTLQVYVSVTTILLVVASWRYEFAIALPKDDLDAVHLIVLSLGTLFITCIILSIVALTSAPGLIKVFHLDPLQPYLWLIPLGVLGGGIYNVLQYLAIRKKQYAPIARTQFSRSLGQNLVQIVSGLLHFGAIGLLAGDIIGKTAGVGALYNQVWRNVKHLLADVSLVKLKELAWRYRHFPLISSFSSLTNSLGLNLPSLLLLSLYGPQVVGWFALGQRVMNIPLTMVGRAVAQVFLGQAAGIARQSTGQLRRFYLKTAGKLLLVGLLPIGLISLAGPWLFVTVFGESWREAGVYIQLLFFASISKFVVNPLAQTLIILERQDIQLVWDILRLLLVVAVFSVPKYFQWPDTYAIGLYSISTMLSYIVLFFLSLYALR